MMMKIGTRTKRVLPVLLAAVMAIANMPLQAAAAETVFDEDDEILAQTPSEGGEEEQSPVLDPPEVGEEEQLPAPDPIYVAVNGHAFSSTSLYYVNGATGTTDNTAAYDYNA